MEWQHIQSRTEGGGIRRTELRPGLADLAAIGKATCAFANSEGGVIIIGVADSGEVVGVREDTERVRERLTSFLQTGCGEPVHARTGRHKTPTGWVHWVEIPRQRGFEPLRYDGRVWVRRERGSVEPSATELQELYNIFGYILTEERAIGDATPSHVDLDAFRSYLRRHGFDTANDPQPDGIADLRNRYVIVEIGGQMRATLYGVLAFGRDPHRYPQTRNFRIECVAYAGGDRASDVLHAAEAIGRLDEQIERAVGWLLSLGHTESSRALVREDPYLLPRAAIREALVNAVAHRDYAIIGSQILLEVFDHRVDVTSPGALPNNITVDSVRAGATPRSRNQSITHFLSVMGLMGRRGTGWHIMRKEMHAFNETEPELVQDERNKFVRVTFYLRPHEHS